MSADDQPRPAGSPLAGPPPLPDIYELAKTSTWLDGRTGLRIELARLRAHADAELPRIAGRAERLSRPQRGPMTMVPAVRTLLRFCAFVLLGVGGEVRARLLTRHQKRRQPARARSASAGLGGSSPGVRRAQQLVRAGGPAYVKVGQSIATAQGLLPDEWVQAFAWCRDEVPPMPPGMAEQAVRASLRRPVEEVFAWFDPVPKAAASIAQVHHARLHDGTEVVVKVQRPGLAAQFASDIRVMAVLTAAAEKRSAQARMTNVTEILPMFAELVLGELDFRLEALNMIHVALASEHAGMDWLGVPRPIPGLVTADVLVMERLPGVPYTAAKDRFGEEIDGKRLLRLAAGGVLEHALVYGVFHGDLHSGNVLVTETGDISLVDFGVTGRISSRERALLIRLLVAAMQQDCRGQVLAAAEFGALPPGADLDAAVAELEKYSALGLEFADASFDSLDLTLITRQLRAVIASLVKFGFKTPKELVLFSRNLLYLNGFASSLAPGQNMLGELEALLAYMTGKYPRELTAILLGAFATPGRTA
jgi:ubiquinone biosynthesis protein